MKIISHGALYMQDHAWVLLADKQGDAWPYDLCSFMTIDDEVRAKFVDKFSPRCVKCWVRLRRLRNEPLGKVIYFEDG